MNQARLNAIELQIDAHRAERFNLARTRFELLAATGWNDANAVENATLNDGRCDDDGSRA